MSKTVSQFEKMGFFTVVSSERCEERDYVLINNACLKSNGDIAVVKCKIQILEVYF